MLWTTASYLLSAGHFALPDYTVHSKVGPLGLAVTHDSLRYTTARIPVHFQALVVSCFFDTAWLGTISSLSRSIPGYLFIDLLASSN